MLTGSRDNLEALHNMRAGKIGAVLIAMSKHTLNVRRRMAALITLAVLLALSWSTAQIGNEPSTIMEALSDYAPQAADQPDEYMAASDFTFRVHHQDGVTVAVSGEGTLNDPNMRFMGALIGAASGYGEGIAGPVADFFRNRATDLEGQRDVRIEVIEFVMYVTVAGGDTRTVAVRFEPDIVDESRFGPAAHVLGPADANFVIREFTDLQCPFCARFVEEGMPIVHELLERGDVRFEVYHFPLKSIHPNATAAAEAAECVASEAAELGGREAGEAAFWTYHDALFASMGRWAQLGDPVNMFVTIATEAGVPSEGLGLCVRSGRFTAMVDASYENAVQNLRLTGTPTVFLNGLKVGDYSSLEEYLRLMRLSTALEAR